MSRELPAPLIGAVHHIQLRETGWWEKAQQESMIAALYEHGAVAEPELLIRYVITDLQLSVDDVDALQASLHVLLGAGRVIRLPNGEVKLAESEVDRLRHEVEAHSNSLRACEGRYAELLQQAAPDLSPVDTFHLFQSEFLFPYVAEFGAATWRSLVTGDLSSAVTSPSLRQFLSHFEPQVHRALVDTTIAFLDAHDDDVRRYVLQLVSAYFFAQSASVDLRGFDFETLYKELENLHFVVVPDLSLLVSVAAKLPVGTVDELDTLPGLLVTLAEGRLVAADLTVREMQREVETLAVATSDQGMVVFSQAQRDRNATWLSWLALSAPRDVPAWLERTAREAAALLDAMGVRIERHPTKENLLSEEEVRRECERLVALGGAGARKSRSEWLHDGLLWQFVQTKRGFTQRVLDADWWLLTEDAELLAYDRNRVRERGDLPVCMHPTAGFRVWRFSQRHHDHDEWERIFLALLRQPAVLARLSNDTETAAIGVMDAADWWSSLGESGTFALEQRLVQLQIDERLLAVGPLQAQVDRAEENMRARLGEGGVELERAREEVLRTLPENAPQHERERVERIFVNARQAVFAVGASIGTISSSTSPSGADLILAPTEREALHRLAESARAFVAAQPADLRSAEDAEAAADQIEQEMKSDILDRGVIHRALSTLYRVAEGAAGNAAYAGIIDGLGHLHHLM